MMRPVARASHLAPRPTSPHLTAVPLTRAVRPVPQPVLPPVQRAFRAIAVTVVPEAERLSARGWEELERMVEHRLATQPAKTRRQVHLFIRVLQWLPLLRFGRTFTDLDAARRLRVLETVGDAPVLLLRRGVWGLRVLVQLGYYTQPHVAAEIGYLADPRGWEARR